MATQSGSGALVYSTEGGRMCPACRRPVADCACRELQVAPVAGGKVRVGLDTKGRGGKSVTLVRGLPLEPVALAALGKQLRAACGSGGTVKDGVVEVQGDHVARISALLRQQGLLR